MKMNAGLSKCETPEIQYKRNEIYRNLRIQFRQYLIDEDFECDESTGRFVQQDGKFENLCIKIKISEKIVKYFTKNQIKTKE